MLALRRMCFQSLLRGARAVDSSETSSAGGGRGFAA